MIIVLIPTFNDWEPAGLLLNKLNAVLRAHSIEAEVLFVDDGSTESPPVELVTGRSDRPMAISILHLRRNLGHQRAIAAGLVYIYENLPCDAVIVMDGDGEDRPEDIPRLLEELRKAGNRSIVFAARAKRLETWTFRTLYHVYRGAHWLLTGDSVRVGNFSAIPFASLSQIVVVPEIWNHYAAAVIRARLGHVTVPIARGARLAGKSKMNFIGLLLHGLSAFFVYGEIVGARLLIALAVALIIEVGLLTFEIVIDLITNSNILTLFWYLSLGLGIVLLQAVPVAFILVFTVIGSRANAGFLPLRDCPYFVRNLERR